MISDKLNKIWLLKEWNNNAGDIDTSIAWNKKITEEKNIICISWEVIIGLSNNISVKVELDTFLVKI